MTADERAPRRIQLSRKAGFNLQAASIAMNGLNAVSVARPGKWGNPFKVGELRVTPPDGYERPRSALEAVEAFRAQATSPGSGWIHVASMLRGKNLACWCKLGDPCHADVLLELANADLDHHKAQ